MNTSIGKFALAFLAALCVLFASCTKNVKQNSFGNVEGRLIDYGVTTEKKICLTFDDGPSLISETILDVLKEKNLKAAFFVIGKNAEKHPAVLKRMFDEGHTVGIHTYTHEYKRIYSSPEALKEDINRCFCAIKAVNCNYCPVYYRFPGGSFGLSEKLVSVPEEMGLIRIDWNASCRDSEIKPANEHELAEYARSTAKNKNNVILLMHDAADKRFTADALPEIISYLYSDGFSFVPLEKVIKIS